LKARVRQRGFTLLEVLVAVAILGLGLTAILSAQFSAVAGVSHARYINVAVGLARCKMTEVEEKLRVDGFQELDQQDTGPCCEGDDGNVYTCSWSVEKPVFPPPNFGELNLEAQLDTTALGALAETGENGTPPPAAQDVDMTSLVAGGVGGVAQMVMSMVYPDLKTLFEASTRRVTVVVGWTEGSRERDLTVVQWVTQPKAPTEEELANAIQQGLQGAASATAAPPSSGAPPAPKTTPTPTPPRPGGMR
jgi:general secretion pathway protein I